MTSPAATAADDAARRAIRQDLSATQFVVAGAGTGKTTALVGRITELLASGRARVDQIAAITFTEAAAAELRDRIGESLERLAGGADGGPGPIPAGRGSDGEERERRRRAADAAADLDAAAIGTLHAFARRVLTEHPFAAGLPPVFEVYDEVRSVEAFDERWRRDLDRLFEDPRCEEPLLRALCCGVGPDQLRALARRLDDNWDLVVDAEMPAVRLEPVDGRPVLDALTSARAMADCCRDPDDRLLVHLSKVGPYVDRLRAAVAAGGDVEVLRRLVERPKLSFSNGRKQSWSEGTIDEVKGLLAEAETAAQTAVSSAAGQALAWLVGELCRCTLDAAEGRRREGRLQFHDLLVRARELVRRDPVVRADLARRYRFLFVDEFQDTDPIQAELAVRIASAEPILEGVDWAELPLAPGRAFFVGDPKQSIYRFRRADLSVFVEAQDRYGRPPLRLTNNYRSVPGVIDWVNGVFSRLFAGASGGAQPDYDPLVASRIGCPGVDSSCSVVVLGGSGPDGPAAGEPSEGKPSADDVRRREAQDVVATIRAAVDERWPVGDDGVPARYSDVAILVPARTGLPILQDALDDAAIPYRLESSSLVYSAPEVVELLAILRSIDDPTDQVALLAALRSPAFGCGDDELVAWRLADGRWDYRSDPPAGPCGTGPVAAGMAWLAGLHRARAWQEVSVLVERVIDERRLLELSLDGPRYRDSWRRLRFIADQARLFADTVSGDLRRFLRWTDLQAHEEARAREVVLPETDDDAVRIMTIHAAKGLEFGIVVLAGLGSQPKAAAGGVGVLFGEGRVEAGVNRLVRTSGYEELVSHEEDLAAAERVRLMYVAATRARDHLVVSLHRRPSADRSFAAELERACDAVPALWRRLPDPAATPGSGRADADRGSDRGGGPPDAVPAVSRAADPPVPPTVTPAGGSLEARDRWIAVRHELVASSSEPATLAATAVAKLAADADEDHPVGVDPAAPAGVAGEDPDPDRPAWRPGRAATAVGRAVHGVLQVVDLEDPADLAGAALAQATVEGVVREVGLVERLAEHALASAVVRRAVDGRYWREVYVAAPIGGRVLEGFVDLLFEGPSGLEVVDYKTDRRSSEEALTRSLRRYRLQGAAYAVAVEEALGRPVAACTFLFLGDGGATERALEDLEAAKAEVRSVVARRSAVPSHG